MSVSGALKSLKSSTLITWKQTGYLQRTLAGAVELTGTGLHSGKECSARISPEVAGMGRRFDLQSRCSIPASIHFVVDSPLCTSLCKGGVRVRTVEHLLSALEAIGVDNCRIQIYSEDPQDSEFEVPILDGSARQWVEEIEKVGLVVAKDQHGNSCEKLAPCLKEPVHLWNDDSFIVAFPSTKVQITYGINFPQLSPIGCQWFSLDGLVNSSYVKQIASARTFCMYEEVENMRNAGLIKGGSLDNAIVCSARKGWLNPPLRFDNEPCRHKILDFIGDFSLFAQFGNQGLPLAHMVAYKGGHALHTEFVRLMNKSFKS